MQRKEFVGLDIGSDSIKLVRLRRGQTWRVVAAGARHIRPDAILEGRIMNFAAVIEAVRSLVTATDSLGLECAIVISGSSLIIKRISVPEMSQQEFEESMLWEAEQYIPFDIKDVNMDGVILNPRAGQGQMDTLMVATKKEIVNEYVSVVVEAGLKPVVVEPSIINLLNLLKTNYPELNQPESEPVVLIDVGANSTKVGVLAGGYPAFFKDLPMGSSSLTQEIQRYFNISWEAAEKWKREIEDPDKINDPTHDVLLEVDRMAEQTAQTLVTEIQRCLDFFVATSIKADITRIYLTGGGATTNHHLINILEKRIEAPVEIFDPFKKMASSPEDLPKNILDTNNWSWATAIGLALRGLDEETPGVMRINLLGQKNKPARKPSLLQRWYAARAQTRQVRPVEKSISKRLRISRHELLTVCDNLGMFISNGVPLLTSLDVLAEALKGS
ncbi:MAG: type IV pilus assembly protein PilM, partial [Candidatus Magasanikbacteria bacterium]|nr:type IV pilus assembly protein PilM [Candidatus Magasanikbacteria bacterium]